MKKIPGHFIILHKCTKDHDHMLYCSWDMTRDGCNCYFSFWPIFLPFYYCNRPKISLFYTIVPKIMIIGYTFPEICMARDVCNCFFSFWTIFYPFTSVTAWKMKILEKEKNSWRYHHFAQVYQKLWSYAILFLKYGTWRM